MRTILVFIMLAGCKAENAPTEAASVEACPPGPVPPTVRIEPEDRAAAATLEAWDLAANRYQEIVKNCGGPSPECREMALAMARARSHAAQIDRQERPRSKEKSQPIPPREQAAADACDRFIELAPADDPEVPAFRFLAAAAYTRYGWDTKALPRLEAVVRLHARDEVSEYAADMLLDTLNRAKRYDELRLWVKVMLSDSVLLEGKPDLRVTLDDLQAALAQHHP